MNIKTIDIVTLADGTFAADYNLTGAVAAVAVVLGTATAIDLTITDKKTAATLYSKATINAALHAQPKKLGVSTAGASLAAAAGPPAVDNVYESPVAFGAIHIAVANGGDSKTAKVYIAYHG